MELSVEQMDQLKKVELEILRSFVVACEAMHLRYYILYGTLLGAVRHKGFIPWDDDIDVGMPREDYDKFVKDGQKSLPENLFIQTYLTDKDYVNGFLKIRNRDTTFLETVAKNRNINHGVFIDVFPLDYDNGFLDKKWECLKFRLYLERLRGELYCEKTSWRSKLLRMLLKIVFPSTRKVMQKREELFCGTEKSDNLVNACGCWGISEYVPIPAEWYGDGIQLEFEGLWVTAPKEYDQWLTREYGDYRKLPPKEKRMAHHDTEVIDLETGYRQRMDRSGKR